MVSASTGTTIENWVLNRKLKVKIKLSRSEHFKPRVETDFGCNGYLPSKAARGSYLPLLFHFYYCLNNASHTFRHVMVTLRHVTEWPAAGSFNYLNSIYGPRTIPLKFFKPGYTENGADFEGKYFIPEEGEIYRTPSTRLFCTIS